MNISANPWSFVPGDVVTSTPLASPNGLLLQPDGTVNFVTAAPHAFVVGNYVTMFNPTNVAYRGLYKVRTVPDNLHANLVPEPTFKIAPGTANSGGGTLALCQYTANVRGEDISWQNEAAAGNLLILVDRNGNPIWEATATAAGSQNRGKVFWVAGLTFIQMDAGIVLITVN